MVSGFLVLSAGVDLVVLVFVCLRYVLLGLWVCNLFLLFGVGLRF